MRLEPRVLDTEMVDWALMTTRGVRMRLDLDRDVDDQVILDCIDVAEQAPTGGNNGSRRWMVIRDQVVKDQLSPALIMSCTGFGMSVRSICRLN